MHCLRCGTKIGEGHSFCADCLASMERYPVKPGTKVIIPERKRTKNPEPKPQKNKAEELVEELTGQVRRLRRWIAVLLLLLAACVGLLVCLTVMSENGPVVGSNYSAITGTDAPGTTTPQADP